MDISPQLFTANVMHKRLLPKVNQFTYSVYYIALPLNTLREISQLAVNKPALISLRERDYGPRDGSELEGWIHQLLSDYGLKNITQHIMFITMPRILGYGFNPVSFYLCLDENHELRAVLCEVHNTFGEAHSYVCAHPDHRPITGNDWLEAEKLFHVSPFLGRTGGYRFRFAHSGKQLGIWIDYMNEQGETMLLTSLTGKLQPLTRASLRRTFWTHPLVTLKTIALIHWQALKLFAKRIRFYVKPKQKQQRVSATCNLTKPSSE